MKKLTALTVAVALASAWAVPALACDAQKAATQIAVLEAGSDVNVKGWITDTCCGAKNAHKDGAGCIKACAKSGAKLVLYTGEKMYVLADQKLALEHVGHEVLVSGTVAEDGSLEITKIDPVEKEKA